MKCMNDLIAARRTFRELQARRRELNTLTGVCQKQLESVGIRITGVSARTAFERESLLKERRDVRGDGSHCLPPAMYASHRSAMLRMSSGTASRYQ
jgi:hypothetical protein